MAQTWHHTDPPRVDIFPKALKNNKWKIEFEQITMITLLQEYVHTIQGPLDEYTEDGFEREVEAYNLSIYWYKNLFPRKRAPFKVWTPSFITAAKERKNALGNRPFRDDMKKIKELRELAKVRDLTTGEEEELYTLAANLVKHIPEYRHDQYYDTGPLVCKDKKKK